MRYKKYSVQKTKRRQFRLPKFFQSGKKIERPDYVLVGLILALVTFGLIMLSSASSVESFRRYAQTYYFVKHQVLFGLLPGMVAFVFFSRFKYQKLERFSMYYLAGAIVLLVLVFVPGIGVAYGNARSWINLFGVSMQPSEIVKLLLILFLASWFAHRGKEMNRDFWNGFMPFGVLIAGISLLIIRQPDIGTLMVVALIGLIMYYVAGARMKHILALLVLGAGSFGVLIAQAPYRAKRLTTFLHPEFDPQGIGYHINQAFLAIGSGGWFGLGFGQSRQKFAYLPEVIGDSIFAIIAEELGFVFSLLLIVAFIALAFRGLKIAQKTTDDYARYLAVGIVSWFSVQAFFNIAAMVGLMPLTGIPLPFISYGGTALFSTLAAAGILVNISRHT